MIKMKLNSKIVQIPQAMSIFINQIVYNKKSRNEYVYTYSLGEAYFDVPQIDISVEEFKRGMHYSSSYGQLALRKKIAELYERHYVAKVDPETEILISAGSKIIIYMLMLTVLSEGDEVLIPEPAWLSYREQLKMASALPVPVPYYIPIDAWVQYITPAARMIIINNPNNPSGQLYGEDDLKKILAIAEKYDLYVMSDEAYSDFLIDSTSFVSIARIDARKKRALVVNSLSKNMGLSGWRIGYCLAHREVIAQLLKVNQHLITCAPTILQNYLARHFHEILDATIPQARQMAVKRSKVKDILDKIGIRYLEGGGTFYFMLDMASFKGSTDELVLDLLLNENIALVSGRAYGDSVKDFVRFGIGIESLGNIEKSLKVIKSYLDRPSYDNSALMRQLKKENITLDAV